MSFICPGCHAPKLAITEAVEIGPDDSSDENTLQLVACSGCAFLGAAEYRESRRGRGECWHHEGFVLTPEDLAIVRAYVATARAPYAGRWPGVCGLARPLSRFPMELVGGD